MTEEKSVTEMTCRGLSFVKSMIRGEMRGKLVRWGCIKIGMLSKRVCGSDAFIDWDTNKADEKKRKREKLYY